MSTPIILETERLFLRKYCQSDLQDLYEYLSDPAAIQFEPYKPMTVNEVRENLSWRIRTDEMIAIELKGAKKMIGNIYLGKRDFDTLEIGYIMNRYYWGHGYATESCKSLIRQAFECGIHRIYAECDPMNAASCRLLERLGFRKEAHFLQNIYFWKNKNGVPIWKGTYVYAMLQEEELL